MIWYAGLAFDDKWQPSCWITFKRAVQVIISGPHLVGGFHLFNGSDEDTQIQLDNEQSMQWILGVQTPSTLLFCTFSAQLVPIHNIQVQVGPSQFIPTTIKKLRKKNTHTIP